MNKIYVVEVDGKPRKLFFHKLDAHEWAENEFGSKSDGICVDGVCVVAYIPINASNT